MWTSVFHWTIFSLCSVLGLFLLCNCLWSKLMFPSCLVPDWYLTSNSTISTNMKTPIFQKVVYLDWRLHVCVPTPKRSSERENLQRSIIKLGPKVIYVSVMKFTLKHIFEAVGCCSGCPVSIPTDNVCYQITAPASWWSPTICFPWLDCSVTGLVHWHYSARLYSVYLPGCCFPLQMSTLSMWAGSS